MQFQADILGKKIERPVIAESTALGAAYLAGLNCGYWNGLDDIAANAAVERVFIPRMSEDERVAKLAGWADAVHRTKTR